MFFFFKQMTAYAILSGLLGSELCISDRNITSRIYIHILDITSRIHIHIWRPPGRLNGGVWGGGCPPRNQVKFRLLAAPGQYHGIENAYQRIYAHPRTTCSKLHVQWPSYFSVRCSSEVHPEHVQISVPVAPPPPPQQGFTLMCMAIRRASARCCVIAYSTHSLLSRAMPDPGRFPAYV